MQKKLYIYIISGRICYDIFAFSRKEFLCLLSDEIYFGINFATTATVIGCIEGAFFLNNSIARPALSDHKNRSLQKRYNLNLS